MLDDLSLRHNQLTGPIPDLSGLTNLVVLDLSENQLTGSIPDLSALTKLSVLSLENNQLTWPIPNLSALTNLVSLDLGHNQLTGQIPDLDSLTNLTYLDLSYNQLTGPVPDLSALTVLATLDLAGNQLCLPEGSDLSGLSDVVAAYLRGLYLPSCASTATAVAPEIPQNPAETEERAALVALYDATNGANWMHSDNWLSEAPIATWYGVYTDDSGRVSLLFLENNGLSGPISDLSALSNLTWLDLSGNQLTGSIPNLSVLTSLTGLDLGHNQLTGLIPDLSELINLWSLNVGANQLTGPIPDLSALTNLQGLNLDSNQLSGRFPDLSALTNLTWLLLGSNQLTGSIPDLSALTNLRSLNFGTNQLTGPIPDLSALTNLTRLSLDFNLLSGPIPDLSALTRLATLDLNGNQLTGQIPDLSALTNLTWLTLGHNQLTGPIPELSLIATLEWLDLSHNQLTGPVLDLSTLTRLIYLDLEFNQLSGPVPDLRTLANLAYLSLTGNQLCLRGDPSLSSSHADVTAHLESLNLPACTDADTMLAPDVPQNLTATIGDGQVTLTWDAVANAASYELRAWDSIRRTWEHLGGILTGRAHMHTVLTDGRNYYYQVRGRDANGVRGAWSERVYAAVVAAQFPPPPLSIGLDMFYQKYLDVGGVAVVAPSEVSDEKMVQAREIISGMISGIVSDRPELLEVMKAYRTRIAIYKYSHEAGAVIQLPEFRPLGSDLLGASVKSSSGWIGGVPEEDAHCERFMHEFAHLIHFAIETQPGGPVFESRLLAAYQAALNAGMWTDTYASVSHFQYWAETVKYWFGESLPATLAADYANLADYDPEVAELIEEVFGDATVPSYCKP